MCFVIQRKSYKFGTSWGWVNDDRQFILVCTISRSTYSKLQTCSAVAWAHSRLCLCNRVHYVPCLRKHFLTFHFQSISLLLNLIVLRALGAAGRYTALICGCLIASFGFGPVSKCCCCLGRHFCQNRPFFIIRLLKHPLLPANSRAAHCQRERKSRWEFGRVVIKVKMNPNWACLLS